MGFQRLDVGVWIHKEARESPCYITYDICAPLFSGHYTTLTAVAMVIDILMLINEPPEKLRDPALEKHHYSYSIYGHFSGVQ